jgi:hypothetical protein
MNLIYSCVFVQESFINLIYLLLLSYKLYGEIDYDYLIITHPVFEKKIMKIFSMFKVNGKIWRLNINETVASAFSRLHIFKYPEIHNYKKILYLDCDVLIIDSLKKLFDVKLENKLYAIKEGNTTTEHHGKTVWEFKKEINPKKTAFSSGVLLFNNCKEIEKLFNDSLIHGANYSNTLHQVPSCLDQPFIIYEAITQNLHNNELLIMYAANNPNPNLSHNLCIAHFPGGVGWVEGKIAKMWSFLIPLVKNDSDKNEQFQLLMNSYYLLHFY